MARERKSITTEVSTETNERGAIDFSPLRDKVADLRQESVTTLLRQAFSRVRDEAIFQLSENLAAAVGSASVEGGATSAAENWLPIHSLSEIRKVVGGRFQNIKNRWVDAGFPLREHRGDREGEFSLNNDGWMRFRSWILEQGYEARICERSGSGALFEIRKILV